MRLERDFFSFKATQQEILIGLNLYLSFSGKHIEYKLACLISVITSHTNTAIAGITPQGSSVTYFYKNTVQLGLNSFKETRKEIK